MHILSACTTPEQWEFLKTQLHNTHDAAACDSCYKSTPWVPRAGCELWLKHALWVMFFWHPRMYKSRGIHKIGGPGFGVSLALLCECGWSADMLIFTTFTWKHHPRCVSPLHDPLGRFWGNIGWFPAKIGSINPPNVNRNERHSSQKSFSASHGWRLTYDDGMYWKWTLWFVKYIQQALQITKRLPNRLLRQTDWHVSDKIAHVRITHERISQPTWREYGNLQKHNHATFHVAHLDVVISSKHASKKVQILKAGSYYTPHHKLSAQ